MRKKFFICTAIYLAFSAAAFCQTNLSNPVKDGTNDDTQCKKELTECKKDDTTIGSFNFSPAIAVEFYNRPYINKASINGPDRIVTVDDSYRQIPSFWLVGNWTLDNCDGLWNWLCGVWHKPGFFIGAKVLDQTGASLTGVSLGLQMAFLTKESNNGSDKKPSWNIGVGWVSHKIQGLADGITPGAPLPSQFDDVKYETKSNSSVIIMISKDVF